MLPPVELPEVPPEVPPDGMPLPVSPPVDPPELAPVLPVMPLAPDVPPEVLPDVPEVPDVPDLPGGVPDSPVEPDGLDGLAPGAGAPPGAVLSVPLVPLPAPGDDGGVVLGDSDGGGVVDGVVVVPVLPVVPSDFSPPPLLQAVTLIASRPIKSTIPEACSFGFIAFPFNITMMSSPSS